MPKMPHIVPKKWVHGAALRRGALPCSLRCCWSCKCDLHGVIASFIDGDAAPLRTLRKNSVSAMSTHCLLQIINVILLLQDASIQFFVKTRVD
jgi:hypothetical protein